MKTPPGISWVLVLALSVAGCRKKPDVEAFLQQQAQALKKGSVEEDISLAKEILWPRTRKAAISRDPFRPLEGLSPVALSGASSEDALAATMKVVGILCKQDKTMALLESPEGVQILREGDRIGRCTIGKIEGRTVIMEIDGKNIVLGLEEEE